MMTIINLLSDEGDDLDTGEREDEWTTSDSFNFEGGDDGLLITCMRSSRSRSLAPFGDDVDVGDSVVFGGNNDCCRRCAVTQ